MYQLKVEYTTRRNYFWYSWKACQVPILFFWGDRVEFAFTVQRLHGLSRAIEGEENAADDRICYAETAV